MKSNSIILKGTMALLAAGSFLTSPANVQAIDLDGSGMSDVFERIYNGGNPLSPTADADGDQISNAGEFNFGLNPVVPNTSPTSVQAISPTEIRYSFYAPTALLFQFEQSTNLQTWSLVGSLLTGANDIKVLSENPQALPKHFIRVRSYGAVGDQDGDLLDGREEAILGTSNTAVSSDADSMPDGWEWFNGLNPLVDDSAGNFDGDSAINSQDARANDPSKGAVQFTITAPANGSSVTQ
jgi:hypothetical protein